MRIRKRFIIAAFALVALGLTSCTNKKFRVEGEISNAKDSMLYFENMSLNGPVIVDSVKLGENGSFSFSEKAPEAPDFYRLRIAGQMINVSIDSTETVHIKATYPAMATQYEVNGSENCRKIKELARMQQALQTQIDNIIKRPDLGIDAVETTIAKTLEAYKDKVKRNYIFKEPMKAYAYFALFQTVVLGDQQHLIFNPRNSKEDNKVYAAVATSWDTFYPKAERGINLHNIALQGMKDARLIEAEQQRARLSAEKVKVSGIIDIALPDNKGNIRRLSDLSGKVVMLDFHVFAGENSTRRIMMLRDLYNKYHAQGFEIYQVSVDPDEHFWKTQTAALPWISVRDEAGMESQTLNLYNVQSLPTFFLIGKDNAVKLRDVQVKDIDAAIKSLL